MSHAGIGDIAAFLSVLTDSARVCTTPLELAARVSELLGGLPGIKTARIVLIEENGGPPAGDSQGEILADCLEETGVSHDSRGSEPTIAIPLRGGCGVIGHLLLTRAGDSTGELEPRGMLGLALGSLLENARLREEQRRTDREHQGTLAHALEELSAHRGEALRVEQERQVLSNLARHLVEADNISALAHAVWQATVNLFDWDAFLFSERIEESDDFLRILSGDTFDGRRTAIDNAIHPPKPYQTRPELHRGEALLINNQVAASPGLNRFGDSSRSSAVLLYAPVTFGGKLHGIVSVQSYTPGRYHQQDLDILKSIGVIVAPALRRLQAERALQRDIARRERLEKIQSVMYQISEAVHRVHELHDFHEEIHRLLKSILYADNLYIMRHDPGCDLLTFMYASEEFSEFRRAPIPVSNTISGRVIHAREPLLINRDEYRRLVASGELIPRLREPVSWLAAPLISGSSVIGVIAIVSFDDAVVYSEDDKSILSFVSSQIADAIGRKGYEAALRASEERYALAARGSNDGLWDWDLVMGTVFYSPRWKQMFGFADEEVGNSPDEWFERIPDGEASATRAQIEAHIQDGAEFFQLEFRMLHRDGGFRWVLCRGAIVRDSDRWATRVAGSFTDITERRAAEEELERAALHDTLTGLPNRALLSERLERCLTRQRRRSDYLFAVLFLDLDRFKSVNDTHGHPVGDRLLQQVARRLEGHLRASDTVARMGGDEFIILLDEINEPREAVVVAERIMEGIAAPFDLGECEIRTATSVGITLSSIGYTQAEDVIRDADAALYQAKASGRGRCVIFDRQMNESVMATIIMEASLRDAIQKGALELHYQPIYSLDGLSMRGLEALVRWRHPSGGLLPPGQFIPCAEESGLIIPLGEWVLREACRQLADWRARFKSAESLFISINISPRQFSSPELGPLLGEVARQHALPPNSLYMEITEGAILDQPDRVREVLDQWRTLGARILLDDFGTGASSLSQLQQLPVDFLKIDRSFINAMNRDDASGLVVRAVLSIAAILHLEVVAEGAETLEQVDALRSMDCQFVQGFYLSRPLEVADVDRLLAGG